MHDQYKRQLIEDLFGSINKASHWTMIGCHEIVQDVYYAAINVLLSVMIWLIYNRYFMNLHEVYNVQ